MSSEKNISLMPYSPLTLTGGALKYVLVVNALSLAAALPVYAGVLDRPIDRATVSAGDTPEAWSVSNGARLTVASGGKTEKITLNRAGALIMDGGTSAEIYAVNSQVTLANSSVVSTTDEGLSLARNGALGDSTSTGDVSNSSITGRGAGVVQSVGSRLTLVGSTVYGTDDGRGGLTGGGTGLLVQGADTAVSGSSITGDKSGIVIVSEGDATLDWTTTLTLDGSAVQGLSGAAIVVDTLFSGAEKLVADIVVGNNSTLSGGNGNILEVSDGHTVNMTVDASQLTGNVVADDAVANLTLQNRSSLTGQLTNVTSLNMDGTSAFHMTDSSTVGSLDLASGAQVHFAQASGYRQLTADSLTGSGTFFMNVDFPGLTGDLLKINGAAEGDHSLVIKSTGLDPVNGDGPVTVVETGGGGANFALRDGKIDYGTFQYELQKQGDDWALVQSGGDGGPIITPSTGTVLGLFSAAPTVWYGELSTLRTRMGELRMNSAGSGGWARAYGNKFDVDKNSGVGYQQNQQGLSFGADGNLGASEGQWLLGVLGGYSESELNLTAGSSGRINSYYVGAYTTWLAPTGYYVDAVVKLNRLENKADVQMSDGVKSKGDYGNFGLGASVEVGKHIKLADEWFVEPFGQVSALAVAGKNFTLDNGLRAEGRHADSFLAKAGATVGRTYNWGADKQVQPYVKVAVAHEFSKGNKVTVNDNRFTNDLSGTRGELGVGVAVQVSQQLQVHVDTDFSRSAKIDQPWGVSAGLRYNF